MENKILSATPKIKNGVQETYVSDKGTFYKYTVSFDNDSTGTAMGKYPEPRYVIGERYTYEKKENNGYITFSAIKRVENKIIPPHQQGQQSNVYISYWDQPKTVHYKMKPLCYKYSVTYFSLLKEEDIKIYNRMELLLKIDQLATALLDFVYEIKDNRQKWARLNLIELAINEAARLPILLSNVKLGGIKQFVLEAEKCINTNAPTL